MARQLSKCPVCDSGTRVSEVSCDRCGAQVRANFDPCPFCRLPAEHLSFLDTFLRCEGNLSRVERELGISYPTVRGRFSAALAALGFSNPAPASHQPDPAERRRTILDRLASGDLSAAEAAEALRAVEAPPNGKDVGSNG